MHQTKVCQLHNLLILATKTREWDKRYFKEDL